jgi:Zn-dependent protease
MFRIGAFRRRPILVHWSVPVVGAIMIAFNYSEPVFAASLCAAYFVLLLIHEIGHAIVADFRRCTVSQIEIYPIHGLCRYFPNTAEDQAFIAWGGVLAQFAVAVVVVAIVDVTGGTRINGLDIAFAVLGYISPVIAIVNLLPVRPLDGASAWRIGPILMRRVVRRLRRKRDITAMEAMESALKAARKKK